MICFQVPKTGTSKPSESGQQFITPISCDLKKEWDRGAARWLAKNHRPVGMTEDDKELRKWVKQITYGRYQPPCTNTNFQSFVELTASGLKTLEEDLGVYQKDGLMPSISIDIWSEDGKSILAVMVYFIDNVFKLHEKLAFAVPFSDIEHKGDEIEREVKKVLASLGIGLYNPEAKIDTVADETHASTTDEGSNVVKALKGFEGSGCVDHKIQNCLEHATRGDRITQVTKKCQRIVAHFRRSDKGFKALKAINPVVTRPNGGSATRWGGKIDIYQWCGKYVDDLGAYVEPPGCAKPDDDIDDNSLNKYSLNDEEARIVHQLAAVLTHVKDLLAILEATLHPTSNLVLPYIGKMIDRLETSRSTTTTYRNKKEVIRDYEYHPKVEEVRSLIKDELERRFEGDRVGHLEDLMICTILDPRFKNFDFKRATSAMKKSAKEYLMGNFLDNFAPKREEPAPNDTEPESHSPKRPLKKQKVRGFLDSDSESEDEVEDEVEEEHVEEKQVVEAIDPRKEEVEKYLSLPQVDQSRDFDLLAWWKLHHHMFPHLANMARQYLACPASSAGVERLFSEAGDTHSAKRKNLKEETMMQLLFISKNC